MNQIDWSHLTHAFGPATDTPDHLRLLTSPDVAERQQGRVALANTLAHQGTRFAATAIAVPLLLELLNDASVPEKPELIRLLVFLAIGYPEYYLPEGLDPRVAFAAADTVAREDAGPEHYDDYEPEVADFWARDAYEATLRGVSLFQVLAKSPDSNVRRAAMFALAWFPDAGRESMTILRDLARSSIDLAERVDAIIALGILGHILKDSSDASWLENELQRDRQYPIRTAAAITLGLLSETPSAVVQNVLLEAIQDFNSAAIAERDLTWHCNGLIGHACNVLELMKLSPTAPVVTALCRSVERAPVRPLLNIISTLCSVVFPDQCGVTYVADPSLPSGQRAIYRDPKTLTDMQGRALKSIVQNPYWETKCGFGPIEEVLWVFGIPTERAGIQDLLQNR